MQVQTQRKDIGKKNILLNNPIVNYVKRNGGILIGFLVLSLALTFSTENFLTISNALNVLRQVSINALIAFGMTFVLIIGGIDLSVGSVVAASGVVLVILLIAKIPFGIALLLAILSGSLFGFLNGTIIAETKMNPFIVTLSTMSIIRGIGYIVTGGKPIEVSNDAFSALGNGYFVHIPIPVLIVAGVLILSAFILNKTIFGRHMYALGGNPDAAIYSGINRKKVQIIVYTICGTFAAIAGVILAARMYSGQPVVGQGYEGDAIAASVLGGTSFTGGIGAIGGTIIGAIVIGILTNGLNLLQISYYWQLVVKGIIIILAVYVDMVKKAKKA